MRVDAHQHYWCIATPGHEWPTPALDGIYRDFVESDLAALLRRHGIARTVAVQSQPTDADTDWLLDQADRHPTIGAVIGWVDMSSDHAATRIETLAIHPKLRGFRPMLQGIDPGWILQDAVQPALACMERLGLVFDALIRPQHLDDIAALADRYPRLAIVVDHAAKPMIADGKHQPWASDLTSLAARPNVSCKLSGLVTEAGSGWSRADIAPYVADVLDAFGPDRLLWGSDWPVLLLASSYDRWVTDSEALLENIDEPARIGIFGANAARIYRIDPTDAG